MSLEHTTIACCHRGCYAIITLHPNEERRLRRTHERFYCPAGHSQVFGGKSEEEQRIADLESWLDSTREDLYAAWNECNLLSGSLTHGTQVCPFGCGWMGTRRLPWRPDESAITRFLDRVYADLANHLRTGHGATTNLGVKYGSRATST